MHKASTRTRRDFSRDAISSPHFRDAAPHCPAQPSHTFPTAPNHGKQSPRRDKKVPRRRVWVPRRGVWVPRGRVWVPRRGDWVPRGRVWVPRGRVWVPRRRVWVPREDKKVPRRRDRVPRGGNRVPFRCDTTHHHVPRGLAVQGRWHYASRAIRLGFASLMLLRPTALLRARTSRMPGRAGRPRGFPTPGTHPA